MSTQARDDPQALVRGPHTFSPAVAVGMDRKTREIFLLCCAYKGAGHVILTEAGIWLRAGVGFDVMCV